MVPNDLVAEDFSPRLRQRARTRRTETYIQFGHSKNVDSLKHSNKQETVSFCWSSQSRAETLKTNWR